MRNAVLALLLISLAFAGPYEWQGIAILATLAGLGVLIIFYLLSYLVDSAEMRGMATSEMYQVVMTGVIIALFVGIESFSTTTMAGMIGADFGAGGTHIDYAINVTEGLMGYQWDHLYGFVTNVVEPMSILSGYSGSCSFLGFSLGYNGCAGIAVPTTSGTIAARTMASSLMILSSQLALLYMAKDFFFPIVLPIGLFLRTFHMTRGTGGFLIAIAASFYFLYPIAILFTEGVYQNSIYGGVDPTYPDPAIETPEATSVDVAGDCNPYNNDYQYTQDMINILFAPDLVDPLLSHFFIEGFINTAICLLIALSGARALTRIFGSEVDVSILARIA